VKNHNGGRRKDRRKKQACRSRETNEVVKKTPDSSGQRERNVPTLPDERANKKKGKLKNATPLEKNQGEKDGV